MGLYDFSQKRIKFRHKIEDPTWNFDRFDEDNDCLLKCQRWYKDYLWEKYKVDSHKVIVHKIVKGSTWVEASADSFTIFNSKLGTADNIDVRPFFDSLTLSPEDFDPKGNFTFP